MVAALETIKLLEAQGQAGKAITAVLLLLQAELPLAAAAEQAPLVARAQARQAALAVLEPPRPLLGRL